MYDANYGFHSLPAIEYPWEIVWCLGRRSSPAVLYALFLDVLYLRTGHNARICSNELAVRKEVPRHKSALS